MVVAHEERESKEKELFAKLRQTEEVNLQRQRELQELITSQQQRLVRFVFKKIHCMELYTSPLQVERRC